VRHYSYHYHCMTDGSSTAVSILSAKPQSLGADDGARMSRGGRAHRRHQKNMKTTTRNSWHDTATPTHGKCDSSVEIPNV
jgi:hypothetical protein